MRTRIQISYGLLLIGISVSLAMPGAAAGRTSYPMFCKNGHGMSFTVSSANNVTTVIIRFKDGWAGKDAEPVPAGHCTWKDRGLRNGEPRQILLKFENVWPEISVDGNATVVNTGVWSVGADEHVYRNLQYVLKAMKRGSEFNFHVYQVQRSTAQGGNYLAVTKVGP